MAAGKTVKLPLSVARRGQPTFAKLLQRFDPWSPGRLSWAGKFFRPGASMVESALSPDASYPRRPLLVEFCGSLQPARGWNRHNSDETVILWIYDRAHGGAFREYGRVAAPAGSWMQLLEPLAREAMREELGAPRNLDVDLIRIRIARVIASELDRLDRADRARVLNVMHDELAARIAAVAEDDWGLVGLGSPAAGRIGQPAAQI